MQKRLSKKFKSISYEAGRRSKKLFDFFKKDEKTRSEFFSLINSPTGSRY